MNITVYLGSSIPKDQRLQEEARRLGTWIGKQKHTLVYGGSKAGLMGDLAESTLQANGKVIGVEPQFFIDQGFEYNDVTELIVTNDMSERKAKMIELGEAFIAFPGGVGTLEELSEVMSKIMLNHLDAPLFIYNLFGYYDDLYRMIEKMIDSGLCDRDKIRKVYFVSSLEEIIAEL